MPIIVKEVDGITGLLTEVLAISDELNDGRFLWFRGQHSEKFVLTPKIMREERLSDAVFERELRLTTRFRQRSMAYWASGYPQDEWEYLFAMQHYGMPTRLLDWSENLFVATHFALTGSLETSEDDGTPVVWCIDPIAWNRSTPVLSEFGDQIQVLTTADEELEPYRPSSRQKRRKSPIAIFGSHNSARIIAQRGTFMVWGNDTRSLEEFAGEQTAQLWKIRVHGDREKLSRQIRSLGFSETMVFPELTSLSIELSRTERWK